MSAVENKAVFLSYASQDAEAAKRICEALRAAGIEVWFDQSELRGGDAWDQKIRRQVKECALFVPIISANTQSRHEGYFRLEWHLAEQRSHLIARSRPFIVPVAVDATSDSEALVPDAFVAVQWMRLPGGEAPAGFCERMKALLAGGGAPASGLPSRPATTDTGRMPAPREHRSPWAILAFVLLGGFGILVVGVVAFLALRPRRSPEEIAKLLSTAQSIAESAVARSDNENKPAAAPLSEARQLVAKAWVLLNKPEMARAELEAADELCKRADALDPSDAEAWAAWSQVNTWYVFHNFDNSTQRRAAARDCASRAMQLDSRSFEARLAQAIYWVRAEPSSAALAKGGEAETMLRELLQEKPGEPRALFTLAVLSFQQHSANKAMELLAQLEKNPAFAAMASKEIAWRNFFAVQWAQAEAAADRSIGIQPYWDNLGLRIVTAMRWRGDLDLAKATLDRMPSSALQEDWGATLAFAVYQWRREPQNDIAFLNGLSRDWLSSHQFEGPKAFLTGSARLMAKQTEAARGDFRRAAELIGKRLVDDPNNENLLSLKARALSYLGERAEAEKTYHLVREIDPSPDTNLTVLFETPDTVINDLESDYERDGWLTAARLRLDPVYDPLRGNPRFAALLAKAEADPRRSPTAAEKPLDVAPAADQKSVAVLPFANLSDDKENEYFSDGISEELLNVLQSIPGLRVAARTSAFSFKGKNATAQEIGQKLGVAHLVEGSVQKSGTRIKVSAHLSRAATGEEKWSQSYTRELKDVFALQEELALAIVGELRGQLAGGADAAAVKAAVKGGTTNPEAHQQYLQGRFYTDRHSEKSAGAALAAYQRAVDLDPAFALAWAGLARTHVWYCEFSTELGRAGFDAHLADAREATERALALEPNLPEALLARSQIQLSFDFDWNGAAETLRTALARAPADPAIVTAAGTIAGAFGDMSRAIELFRQAVALDPVNPAARSYLAYFLAETGRSAEAQAEYPRVAELNPAAPWAHAGLGLSYLLEGKFDEAVTSAQDDAAEWARLLIVALAR